MVLLFPVTLLNKRVKQMLTGHLKRDVDFFIHFFMVQMKGKLHITAHCHASFHLSVLQQPPSRCRGHLMVVTSACAPARRGSRAVPARRSGSVAEEKGGGPGADPVSADSAEGGQGRGGGGTPGRHRLAKTSRSRGILAGPGGKNKLIQFKRV